MKFTAGCVMGGATASWVGSCDLWAVFFRAGNGEGDEAFRSPDALQAINWAGVANGALRQTRVGDLSMWKACAFSNAARNRVFAAVLAQRGMTGPSPIFEGEKGIMKLVSVPSTFHRSRESNFQDDRLCRSRFSTPTSNTFP